MKRAIGIVGAGNMGGAMYKIWKQKNQRVYICDHNESKIKALNARKDVLSLQDLLVRADVIVLAVKPQSLAELADEIKNKIENKLVISVMAGVSTRSISTLLRVKKVVRVMPNMPARIGQGVSGWFAGKHVSKAEKTVVARLFSALGLAVEIKQEALLDAVAAVSGSGPAYFFYLCEQLGAGAIKLGLDKKTAMILAEQAFLGSAALLKNKNMSTEQLRQSVISRKGTTAAAMSVLEKRGFAKIFEHALSAALKRARELRKMYE